GHPHRRRSRLDQALTGPNTYHKIGNLSELKIIINQHIDAILNNKEKLQTLMSEKTKKQISILCTTIEKYKHYDLEDLLDAIESTDFNEDTGKETTYFHVPYEFNLHDRKLWESLNENEFKNIIE
ncbi:hypothetical protein, partial [Acetobacter senegalensis]|uniref:hypothetical protein n=1 Tax=Acetobacter senegalensis TaxID=446692 RepID=UPI00264EF9E4